jgi:HlyD family secretion protein
VVAPGQVQVDQSRQIVQHPDGGVVESVLVREGQAVAKGDLLLRLEGSALQSEREIVAGQLHEALASRMRLEAERDDLPAPIPGPDLAAAAERLPAVRDLIVGQTRLFQARTETFVNQRDQIGKRIEQTTAQTGGIDAQITAAERQLVLIQSELTDTRTLRERGLAQTATVSALEREEARLMGQLGELAALRAGTEGQITALRLEALRLAAERRELANEALREVVAQESELRERLRALDERIERLDIRAPVAGLVLGLRVTTPQAVIRPADPVLFLIPQDRPLVIEARISPYNIDEVHVGQGVRLVLPGVQIRPMPELSGQVTLVSADALTDEATGQAYYRAEIVPDPGEMAKLGMAILVPGMPVEAFIQTAERTPLAYLLQPFTSYFRRAFRES